MIFTAEQLRNEIYTHLSGKYETMGEELPHAEMIDEDALKVMFIDEDANCFRITVEAI